jgi:plastocyanin
MTYNVVVGMNETLTYMPNQISGVNVGDTIAFTFAAKNHTVTQSSFVNPCSNLSSNPQDMLDSGFQFVPAGAASLPQWSFTVSSTAAPLWFYCRQTTHCEKGMVFAINPTATKTYNLFQQAANGTTISANGTATPGTTSGSGSGSAAPGSGSTTGTSSSPSASASNGARALGASAAGLLGVAGFMSLLL